MNVSRKCQYALRALFELALRSAEGVVSVGQIAETQAIPTRFLELILADLRRAGYVESRRGVQGGYALAVQPTEVSVGDVIRLIDGPLAPVPCLEGEQAADCPLYGRCSFLSLWERAAAAVAEVYDGTSLADLVEEERASRRVLNYCI